MSYANTSDRPPAYTWVDPGSSAIAFEWIGESDFVRDLRQPLYRLSYETRGSRRRLNLGTIERLSDGWVVRSLLGQKLPEGESLSYPSWEAARDWLWSEYQSAKVAANRERLAA